MSDYMSGAIQEIPEWPDYGVTNDGRVFSYTGWRGVDMRQLTANADKNGYLRVRLGPHRIKRGVHQLVMRVFGEPCPGDKYEIRHLDGNPANNDIANLKWGTQQDNADDREKHGNTSRGATHAEAVKRGQRKSTNPYWRHAR